MIQKLQNNEENGQNPVSKKKKRVTSAAIAAASVMILASALIGCSTKINAGKAEKPEVAGAAGQSLGQSQEKNQSQSGEQGEDLVIPVKDISSTAKFYPVEADGTNMEVIAVQAPDGTIRTAFNTCQVCFDSGRGYYKQEVDALVCQNCRNRFPMDRVEVEAGGCNPWPIFDKNKTVTDESITISSDFFEESKEIFANWRTSYE